MRTIEQILIGLRAWACDDHLGDGMLLREAAAVIEALQAHNDAQARALELLHDTMTDGATAQRMHLADDDERPEYFYRDDE